MPRGGQQQLGPAGGAQVLCPRGSVGASPAVGAGGAGGTGGGVVPRQVAVLSGQKVWGGHGDTISPRLLPEDTQVVGQPFPGLGPLSIHKAPTAEGHGTANGASGVGLMGGTSPAVQIKAEPEARATPDQSAGLGVLGGLVDDKVLLLCPCLRREFQPGLVAAGA